MTPEPPYLVHHVDERSVTVDWFFGRGHAATKVVQLVLVLLGWFFALLPVVITASALLHRDDPDAGWWGYHEGFVLWDMTMLLLGVLTVLFVIGFLALFLVDRASEGERNRTTTYDASRLARRREVAADLYAEKFGPEALRLQQTRVEIQPYGDLETYELRGRYRDAGVE
jgi:uncharacterized membrane protein